MSTVLFTTKVQMIRCPGVLGEECLGAKSPNGTFKGTASHHDTRRQQIASTCAAAPFGHREGMRAPEQSAFRGDETSCSMRARRHALTALPSAPLPRKAGTPLEPPSPEDPYPPEFMHVLARLREVLDASFSGGEVGDFPYWYHDVPPEDPGRRHHNGRSVRFPRAEYHGRHRRERPPHPSCKLSHDARLSPGFAVVVICLLVRRP